MALLSRYLAGQFASPRGPVGRWLIGPWLDRIGSEMNRLAADMLQVRGDEQVLEVGFGGGALLGDWLERTSGTVTGIDMSEAMVERARRRYRTALASGRLRLARGSVEALPLADASVDKACSVNAIYFWPDPHKAMAELARVIRPGGRLALCFEQADSLRQWPGHRFGFRLFEEQEVQALLAGTGFRSTHRREGRGRKPDFFLCLAAERVTS